MISIFFIISSIVCKNKLWNWVFFYLETHLWSLIRPRHCLYTSLSDWKSINIHKDYFPRRCLPHGQCWPDQLERRFQCHDQLEESFAVVWRYYLARQTLYGESTPLTVSRKIKNKGYKFIFHLRSKNPSISV